MKKYIVKGCSLHHNGVPYSEGSEIMLEDCELVVPLSLFVVPVEVKSSGCPDALTEAIANAKIADQELSEASTHLEDMAEAVAKAERILVAVENALKKASNAKKPAAKAKLDEVKDVLEKANAAHALAKEELTNAQNAATVANDAVAALIQQGETQ